MKISAQHIPSKDKSKVLANGGIKLSVSKAKTFDDCKAKFKYCYIEKLPRKEWDFHIFGKFMHDVLENFELSLIKNNKQDFRKLMTKSFKKSLKEYKDKLSAEHKEEAKSLLHIYLSDLEKKQQQGNIPNVIGVEKSFYIDIGHSVLLNGFIDRIQEDHDGILHVADYKTTKNKKYLNDFFQLKTYAFALMLEDENIKKIRASYVLLRHGFEYLTKEYSRDEIMKISEKFINYASQINEEKLWAPSPKFLCKYCDYLDVCKDGRDYLTRRNIIKIADKSNVDYGLSEW